MVRTNSSKWERPTATLLGAEKNWNAQNEMRPGRNVFGKLAYTAKVEVEQRALKVIKCEADLASARVRQAERQSPDGDRALRPVNPRNKSWRLRKRRSRS